MIILFLQILSTVSSFLHIMIRHNDCGFFVKKISLHASFLLFELNNIADDENQYNFFLFHSQRVKTPLIDITLVLICAKVDKKFDH